MASSGVRRRSSAKNSVDGARIVDSENAGIASASFASSRSSSISKVDQAISSPISEAPPSARLAELMGSPSAPAQTSGTRQSRASTASSTASGRLSNPNRLSLTLPLPIALPSPDPTRPTPSSSAAPVSHPPTPAPSSLTHSNSTSATSIPSPDADPNDFIIAIAAQERRVLELREELARAEADLSGLKSQWTQYEGTRKRTTARVTRTGGMQSMPSTPRVSDVHAASQDDGLAARRSVELDRRRTMLLNQQHSTPSSPRRRVLRGGHTRTLSLLSPTKTDGTYSLHEDGPLSATLNLERRSTDLGSAYRSAAIQKRASWQPRVRPANSAIPPPGMGMAAIVEDLKLGFRTLATFVDDIRQVTVGDEPITGQIRRRGDEEWVIGGGLSRSATPSRDVGEGQQTIRPAGAARPTLDSAFEAPAFSSSSSSGTQTPSKPSSKKSLLDEVDPVSDRSSSKAAARKKHFSWAPLEFSNLDEEWAAWDSPLSTKSTRWSDSNDSSSNSSDDAGSKNGETDTPIMKKSAAPNTTSAFDEMVTRLSPSNLKRATTDFMGQWERSLTMPSSPITPVAAPDDHENLISL